MMTQNITNFDFMGFLGGMEETASNKAESVLDQYEEAMKKGELLDCVQFSQSEYSEGLMIRENGVEIFLPKEEISPRFKDSNLKREALNRLYAVKVMSVDRNARRVTVSHIEAQKEVRPNVIAEIEAELAKNGEFRAQARVVLLAKNDTVAFVDIFGLGIRGVIFVKEWTDSYVKSLSAETKVGDLVDIAIIGHSKESKENDPQYECSRRRIIEEHSPWKGIETRLKEHSNVIIRCVDKRKNNFLAKIDGEENLTVYALYPDKPSKVTGENIVIKIGSIYSGYIYMVSEEKRVLRVRVLDEIPVTHRRV